MLQRYDLLCCGLAVLHAVALAPAQDGTTDLLGPENAHDLGQWNAVSGAWKEQSSPWSKIAAYEGASYLRPTAGDAPELEQIVDLEIDGVARPTHLLLRAWVRTGRGRDRAAVRLELFDRDNELVAELDSGEQAATRWTSLVLPLAVPSSAVRARVSLHGVRNEGDFADALFDGLALEDFGPGRPVGYCGLPTERLFALLDDGAPRVRRAAARALAVEPAAQRPLLERWREEADAERRTELAIALALCAGALANEPISGLLASRVADQRELALALLPLTRLDATALLVPLLDADTTSAVRRAAIAALAAQGRADGVRALQRLCRADPKDARLVLEIVRKSAGSLDPFYRPLLVPVLDEDADAVARREAMRTLGERGDARFLIHFVRLAPKESSPDLLAQWFRWAAAIDGDRAISTILALVDDSAPGAERAFLAASSKLRAKAALDWARRRGFASDSPNLRRAAIRLMASSTNPKDVQALRAATADAEMLVAIEAVEVLTARPGERVEDLLERLYTRAPGAVAAAALRGLVVRSRARADSIARVLGAIGGHQRWEVRVAGLDLLEPHEIVGGIAIVRTATGDRQWQVRAASYRALSRWRDRASVDILVARLETESGPALSFLCDALVELTGVDQGDDAPAWQRWWNVVAVDFVVATERPARPATRPKTSTAYWGIPIRGHNLAFVLDLSGSMTAKLEGKTRLEIAKERLLEVLRTLGREHRFALVGFGTDIAPFADGLSVATPENVERAIKWVDRLRISGATNIYDSLEFALAIPEVESVFLLTDGAPSTGKLVDMGEIRLAIRLQNAERYVRVNTIQIGGGGREQAFLRGLAKDNHGEARRR